MKERDTILASASQANEQLAKQAEQLNADLARQQTALKDLNAKIADKEKLIETASGERDLLTRELKDLMANRTELERQLHDLAFLREQIAQLKSEERTARRFAWARAGTLHDERKGAQRLVEGNGLQPPLPASTGTGSALAVELRRDGTVQFATPAPRSP